MKLNTPLEIEYVFKPQNAEWEEVRKIDVYDSDELEAYKKILSDYSDRYKKVSIKRKGE